MFRWYSNAGVCYVLLADVLQELDEDQTGKGDRLSLLLGLSFRDRDGSREAGLCKS